jgi:hypothetical protein
MTWRACGFATSALVLALAAASPAGAAPILFEATLTNEQEVPAATPLTTALGAPRPASSGTASLVLNEEQTALTYSITIQNIDFTGSQTADLNDNLTVAHIHGGPGVTAGVNGPVLFGFVGSPFNDNNPNDVVVTPFAVGVGGTITGKWDAPEGQNTTLADQIANLLAGHTYLNFHTVQFPGGEVRGQITVVPEPGTALLLAFGTAMIAGLRRRRGEQSRGV